MHYYDLLLSPGHSDPGLTICSVLAHGSTMPTRVGSIQDMVEPPRLDRRAISSFCGMADA